MKIVVNGLSIEGKDADVLAVLKQLGVSLDNSNEYYYSRSSGNYIEIKSMETRHLSNAFNVIYKEWLDFIARESNHMALLRAGIQTSWPKYNVYIGLITELIKREKEGK